MKNKVVFAKIIDLENHQVVVMKDFDSEDDVDILWTVSYVNGVLVQVRAGFKKEQQRDKAFREYNDVNAREFIDGILSMLNEES